MSNRAVVGLGSNQGNPEKMLLAAARALEHVPGIVPSRLSNVYWTEPVGPAQPLFLNGALLLETDWEPAPLLGVLLGIEAAWGRQRTQKLGPRILDLDLLVYEDRVVREAQLTLPHPRLAERAFALLPLVDVWPEARIPGQSRTYAELLPQVDHSGVGEPQPLPARVSWYHLDHTAEMRFSVSGTTASELFENAAWALMDLMVDRQKIRECQRQVVIARGDDQPTLLVALLRELFSLVTRQKFLPRRVHVLSMDRWETQLVLYGEPLREPDQLSTRVQAVPPDQTVMQLTPGGRWRATVVLDV